MKIKKGFVVRKVGEDNIAVPIGEMSKRFRGMIKLNGTGLFLWNFFGEDRTREDAVTALTSEYAVSPEEAEKGVDSFISMAAENGFLE